MANLPPIVHDILGLLLDRYERPNRQRVVRVRLKDDAPAYAASSRQECNEMLQTLAAQGWVALHWEKNEADNWLRAVDLNIDYADQVYELLARTPRLSQAAALKALIAAQTPRGGWHTSILDWLVLQLESQRSVAPFNLDDPKFNRDLLTALAAIADLRSPVLERTLSSDLFGDSKRLESLRAALATLLRRHSPFAADYETADDLLRTHQLHRIPEYVPVAGPLTFSLNGKRLETEPFWPSLALSAETLRSAEVVECRAPIILTVENATSFTELTGIRPSTIFFIFTGGFPSLTVIGLLRAIRDCEPTCRFFHWGDMDAGGFRILAYLRKHIPEFRSLGMEVAIFDTYCQQTRTVALTASDRTTLQDLRGQSMLGDCVELIDRLLSSGRKLEQEAIRATAVLEKLF